MIGLQTYTQYTPTSTYYEIRILNMEIRNIVFQTDFHPSQYWRESTAKNPGQGEEKREGEEKRQGGVCR